MKIVFDIGGTHTRIARVDTYENGMPIFSDRVEFGTPQDFNEAQAKIVSEIKRLSGDETPEAISGSIPGKFNREDGLITYAPHLLSWVGKSFSLDSSAPLYIENDAALAGLAEAKLGAGIGKDIVVYITVSTGIGGARIVHGKIDETKDGFEPGHQIVDWNTKETLENLVSGEGIKKHYGAEIQLVTDGAHREEAARILAVGIHNMIVHWSPDIVVVGGPVILSEPGIDLTLVKKFVAETLKFNTVPDIVPAKLNPDGGLIGAALHKKQ